MIRGKFVDQRMQRKQNPGMFASSSPESRRKALWLVCLFGVALVALVALTRATEISALLLDTDSDDQMRLVTVRDLLEGQSWWDNRQYRVLPPEGISLHWSRYVDAGIGAILYSAGLALPGRAAELATVILWPSLLACIMVLVLVHGTGRLFGTASAIGALVVFLGWNRLGGEFAPPRIDHHNVQILGATAVFYLSLIPGRAWLAGGLGGVVTAFSLAVGLEMLPVFATLWGLMSLRHAFGQASAGPWLVGFGAAITLSAPLFMAGQTPIAEWGTPWCDALATPVLTLGLVGVVATVTTVLTGQLLSSPLARIALLISIAGGGLWLTFPFLEPCLAGPYSGVGPEVRAIIEGSVIEARSARTLLDTYPALLGRVVLPPLVIAGLALAVALRLRGRIDPLQANALLQGFVVVAVGFGLALVQIRAANLMAPALPLLGGFLVYAFTLIPRYSWQRLPALVLLVMAIPTVVQNAATRVIGGPMPFVRTDDATGAVQTGKGCRTETAMAELSRLPPALIFSNLNLGPTILLYTRHSTTSAAYHRSMAAYWNGSAAFQSAESLQVALSQSGADYLLICHDSPIERGSAAVRGLMSGDLPDWLTDVTADRSELLLLKVDKAGLAVPSP